MLTEDPEYWPSADYAAQKSWAVIASGEVGTDQRANEQLSRHSLNGWYAVLWKNKEEAFAYAAEVRDQAL